MAWYDGLVGTENSRYKELLDNAENDIDFSALGFGALEGAEAAITDPETYLQSIALIPGARLGGLFKGTNSVRNARPNWVFGEAGKGGRSWRWGADGPPAGGGTNQVRAIPQGKGGLPATQGGLPAVTGGGKGGLPAVIPKPPAGAGAAGGGKGGLPAVIRPAAGDGRGQGFLNALGLGAIASMFYPDETGDGGTPPPLVDPYADRQYLTDSGTGGGGDLAAILEALNGGAGEGGGGREFATLPQIDYENLPAIDYEGATARLDAAAPTAPEERSFLQDLGQYVIPALAGGIVGGLPGVILGGLMGEGNRQTNVQRADAEFADEMAEYELLRAKADLSIQESQRLRELEQQMGIQQQTMDNYNFRRGQEDDAREDAAFLRDNRRSKLDELLAAMQIRGGEQEYNMRQRMLGGMGGPQNNMQIFQEFVTANPQVYAQLQNDETFQEFLATAATDNKLGTEVQLANILRQLEANPEYAPILRSIRQNIAQTSFLNGL